MTAAQTETPFGVQSNGTTNRQSNWPFGGPVGAPFGGLFGGLFWWPGLEIIPAIFALPHS